MQQMISLNHQTIEQIVSNWLTHKTLLCEGVVQLGSGFVLEFEDVLLLLIVSGHLAYSVSQADGELVVVGDTLARILVVLVEAHLMVVDHTIDVMPRPGGEKLTKKSDSLAQRS